MAHLPTISKSPPNQGDESEGYEYPDRDILYIERGLNAGEMLYRQLFQFKKVVLQPCELIRQCLKDVPADGLQLNDFMVTLEGARHDRLCEIASQKHNHTIAGKVETASVVLATIRDVEAEVHPVLCGL